jgi:hypothetical protein
MSVIVFSLIVFFFLLMIPVYQPVMAFIRGIFAALVCMDIINSPYSSDTFNVVLRHCSSQNYYVSRKIILRDSKKVLSLFKKNVRTTSGSRFTSEIAFYYKDGKRGVGTPYQIALRNILIADPNNLQDVEDVIIEKGQKNPRLIYGFAVITKDLDFSRRRLFVAISKLDPRYRNDFVSLFKEDAEIEKLAALS